MGFMSSCQNRFCIFGAELSIAQSRGHLGVSDAIFHLF